MRNPTNPHGGASKKALEAQTDESPDFLRIKRSGVVPLPLSRGEVGLAVVLSIIVTSLFWWWMKL